MSAKQIKSLRGISIPSRSTTFLINKSIAYEGLIKRSTVRVEDWRNSVRTFAAFTRFATSAEL